LSQTKRIVVKVGSSLLANPELLTPRWAFIQRLLEDIALLRSEGYEVVLTSSGAVALGLNTLNVKPENAGLRDKQAAAACGMPIVLNAYKQVAHEFGFDIAQVLVTRGDLEERRRFLNTKNTVHRLLNGNVMPIVNENDTITTEEIRVGDNDRLAARIAQMIQAQHLVILTSVDGLYDKDPSEPGAKLVEELHDVSEYLSVTEGTSALGSGGMLTKMQAANMAQNAGCTTLIANGEADNPVSSVLKNQRPHTKCIANTEPASAWTAWLTDRLQMAGSLVITNAAADALAAGTRGVERADVQSIHGPYVRSDVIHIYDEEGLERARGLTNFSSEETMLLARNLDTETTKLLGYHTKATLVSRDNLVVLDERHLPWDSPAEDEMEPVAR
jgi:glutamate 5-kinase|tara:strand:- start:61550 stop:62710 length:1161 start_codon:yes stop_codon:yes gene_type:complete